MRTGPPSTAWRPCAAIMGETQWLKLPQRAIRIGTAVVLTLAGVVFGLSALRLI